MEVIHYIPVYRLFDLYRLDIDAIIMMQDANTKSKSSTKLANSESTSVYIRTVYDPLKHELGDKYTLRWICYLHSWLFILAVFLFLLYIWTQSHIKYIKCIT